MAKYLVISQPLFSRSFSELLVAVVVRSFLLDAFFQGSGKGASVFPTSLEYRSFDNRTSRYMDIRYMGEKRFSHKMKKLHWLTNRINIHICIEIGSRIMESSQPV